MRKGIKIGYSRYSVTCYTLAGYGENQPVMSVSTTERVLKRSENAYAMKPGHTYKKIKSPNPCEQTFIKSDRIIITGKKVFNYDYGPSLNSSYTFLLIRL